MTPDEFDNAVKQIMAQIAAMTLATCGGGIPWATDVYFAADGFDLVFFSSPSSRHCRNLAANPACAATIHPNAASWREIKGLQMEGIAEPMATVGDKARGLAAYLQKFPFARELVANPKETTRAFNKAMLYVFRPSRILYLDNSLGFGTRYCVRLMEGRMGGIPEREKST
jgi:uncharacterized protein YhbP (UPF0306 family)